MTKSKAIQLMCGKNGNQNQLAKALGVARSSVCEWDDDKIPWARELQIKELVRKRREAKAKKRNK